MSNYNWKTKKEIIIENACRDPFLKIDDLAEMASTTSRYVRTILSESNISLMKLRKEYARKAEFKNSNIDDLLLLKQIKNVPFKSNDDILEVDELIFNNAQDIDIMGDIYQDYFFHSYEHFLNDNIWCISTVFLNRNFFECNDAKISFANLMDYFVEKLKSKIKLSDIEISTELSTGQIAAYLNIKPLTPIMQARQKLSCGNKTCALILIYLNTKRICFSLSQNKGIIIKRKSVAG
ncbi:MAG: hypothetical protein ACOCRZ_06410 [Halothermotrichaceae bacterium]